MNLHFLNPDDEPRDCKVPPFTGCEECEEAQARGAHCTDCACRGTGRLGREGHQPEIEVQHFGGEYAWRAAHTKHLWSLAAYPTESDALAAAREALG